MNPPVVAFSVTSDNLIEEDLSTEESLLLEEYAKNLSEASEEDLLLLEDGCDYQNIFVNYVEYSHDDTIPYDFASDGSTELAYNDPSTEITPQVAPLIALAAPHVFRYAGKLMVTQVLKYGTKNLVIRNGHLAGKLHPITRVKFSSQGFPQFAEKYAMVLPANLFKSSNSTQFAAANKALKASVDRSSSIRNSFKTSELTDIRNGKTPGGYTWHHHELVGRMELVKTIPHKLTGHTGGKAIWGTN